MNLQRSFWWRVIGFTLGFVITITLLATCGCGRNLQAEQPAGDPLPAPRQVMLDGVWLKAKACGIAYATEKHRPINRIERPKVVIVDSEDALLAIKKKESPGYQKPAPLKKGGRVVLSGLTVYDESTIYVLGMDYETLAHEYGHWFFGASCEVADDFAAYMVKWERLK